MKQTFTTVYFLYLLIFILYFYVGICFEMENMKKWKDYLSFAFDLWDFQHSVLKHLKTWPVISTAIVIKEKHQLFTQTCDRRKDMGSSWTWPSIRGVFRDLRGSLEVFRLSNTEAHTGSKMYWCSRLCIHWVIASCVVTKQPDYSWNFISWTGENLTLHNAFTSNLVLHHHITSLREFLVGRLHRSCSVSAPP